jgi:hypothetical protein
MAERRQSEETGTMTNRRRISTIGLAFAALLAAASLWAGSAQAAEGIDLFEMTPTDTQAGGHPDVTIKMEWDDSAHEGGKSGPSTTPCACDDGKTVTQHFPTGFIGNPTASPPCEIVEFSFGRCPASTQIGTYNFFEGYGPLYNLTPHPDEPALVAFWVPLINAPVFISLSGRTESDYGLDAETSPIYHPLPLNSFQVTLWGVPAAKSHDLQRFTPPLQGTGECVSYLPETCPPKPDGNPANVPPIPYLENPTQCGVPLFSSLDLLYYTGGFYQATDPWPSTTGCEQLTFNPSLTAQPTTADADSPSGVDVVLAVPQEQSPTTPSPSEIQAARTVLPEGFSLNPNAADGKVACSDEQTAIGTRHGATCPEFSKVGTVTLDSAALPAPIPGAIYLGDPKPGDRYRLVLAADGYGTHIKIAGSVKPDPQSGQLTIHFDELPQSPLTEFDMHFFGSERGILATPTHCGSYPVESEFVPWDNELPVQHSTSSFVVDAGVNGAPCPATPRPFSPVLRGGSLNPSAGKSTPVSVEIERPDGDQFLEDLQVTAPPGVTASLQGITYCPESTIQQLGTYTGRQELERPLCPESSQIGTATAGAGAGSHPLYVPGKVFLAGPYKGEPLSLVAVTPAVSGPYDLGNVVVRAAIHVDPTTAQVTVASDQLPKIVGGIPLRIRAIKIVLDRPNFTLNPTNCAPFAMGTRIDGQEGASASPSVPYQVTNCASMPFSPRLSLSLTGGLRRLGHPAIHGVFVANPGDANSKKVVVALPKGELLDNKHLGTVCTRPNFDAGRCQPESVIGNARVTTPLLDQPLEGKVYLRSSSHGLPDLAMDLRGQVDVHVIGRVGSRNSGLVASFENLPDVPVGRLEVNLFGGSKGLLQNSESLCGANKHASVEAFAQNNATFDLSPKLKVKCGSAGRHRRHRASGKGGR